MAVKVFRHGNRIAVQNPVNPNQVTNMLDVTFVETGRQGANYQVADTSNFIDQMLAAEGELEFGETTGLDQMRIHTQPIREDQAHKFPIGKEFRDAYINRHLFSTPQLRQQTGVKPRMIDGKPTFFTTTMEGQPKDDVDHRLDNNILAGIHPEYFEADVVSQTARVDVTERPRQEEQLAEMNSAMGTHPLGDLRYED